MGGSATGTLGANNEATWCDIFPNVPPAVPWPHTVGPWEGTSQPVADGENGG